MGVSFDTECKGVRVRIVERTFDGIESARYQTVADMDLRDAEMLATGLAEAISCARSNAALAATAERERLVLERQRIETRLAEIDRTLAQAPA